MTDNITSGSLEQLGINVETQLPDGVLTPAESKGVRFTQTRPGYHFREVEAYKEEVDKTLDSYAAILHTRDMDVYNLGAELDRARVDVANLRNQIEVYEYQGGIATENATDEEVATLLAANEELRNKVLELEAKQVEIDAWTIQVEDYVASLEAQLAAAQGGVTPIVEEVAPVVEETIVAQPVVEEVVESVVVEEEIPLVLPTDFSGITEDDLR